MIRSISAPFFSSSTIRMPSLSDWFEMSTISGSFFASTNSATSCMNFMMPWPIMV